MPENIPIGCRFPVQSNSSGGKCFNECQYFADESPLRLKKSMTYTKDTCCIYRPAFRIELQDIKLQHENVLRMFQLSRKFP